MIKNKKDAICAHLMLDTAELEDYRYHYGHTSQPVYAFTYSYYCATKGKQKPAIHRSGLQWDWKEVPDPFVNGFGYKIWKHTNVNE